jgi:glycerol uptake facilitator-like aquaporin
MWALDKCSYTEAFVRIAGQMGGGLVAFPFFNLVSEKAGLTPFGGPECTEENYVDGFFEELVSTFLLMWVIYIVSEAPNKNICCRSANLETDRNCGQLMIHVMLTLDSFPCNNLLRLLFGFICTF